MNFEFILLTLAFDNDVIEFMPILLVEYESYVVLWVPWLWRLNIDKFPSFHSTCAFYWRRIHSFKIWWLKMWRCFSFESFLSHTHTVHMQMDFRLVLVIGSSSVFVTRNNIKNFKHFILFARKLHPPKIKGKLFHLTVSPSRDFHNFSSFFLHPFSKSKWIMDLDEILINIPLTLFHKRNAMFILISFEMSMIKIEICFYNIIRSLRKFIMDIVWPAINCEAFVNMKLCHKAIKLTIGMFVRFN